MEIPPPLSCPNQKWNSSVKKKACYVLMLSETYPKGHKLEGKPTNFENKILDFVKIHTLRANYPLWKKRFEKIDKDEAYLSVRKWSGKPYRSKQVELFKFHSINGIGIQKLELTHPACIINNYGSETHPSEIAMNDGLTLDTFIDWFKGYPTEPMAIIHFTSFRYN